MVDEISKAIALMGETLHEEPELTYADYQSGTFQQCKAMSKHSQEMVSKSSSAPDEMVGMSRQVTDTYTQLVESARGALATIESAEVSI